jgi:hypothetical protein
VDGWTDRFFFPFSFQRVASGYGVPTDDGDDIPHAPGILGLRFRSHNLPTASTHHDSLSCDNRDRNPSGRVKPYIGECLGS